jgi:hypothetical protein
MAGERPRTGNQFVVPDFLSIQEDAATNIKTEQEVSLPVLSPIPRAIR